MKNADNNPEMISLTQSPKYVINIFFCQYKYVN